MDYSKYDLEDLFRLYFLTKEKFIHDAIDQEIHRRNLSEEEIAQARNKILAENLDKVKHRGLSTLEFMQIFLLPFKQFKRKKLDFEENLSAFDNDRWNPDEIPDIKLARIMGYAFYLVLGLLIFAIFF